MPGGLTNRIDDRWLVGGCIMAGLMAPTAATAPGGPMPGTGRMPGPE